ncbi:LytTR family DNA-binding domain-containing protein [Undibacterium sp. Jales W-56]|uniref:LytR/AlgR family response regulator transcription factor n=1 Tax=Undibacterium sp. Jales W-56 TaxID=2897325 RepID=UPI0021D2A5E1|nr:LytTR family DNA-binding domain-containing protein [Undibacterium sp. Jales W-56]MCU6433722.1 LytTR family DNA-binding domain-containing protein [Undibacterium sp. Jales W-56]
MTKPTIFIVDDEAPARQRLTTLLTDIQAECPCELVGEASMAQAALDGIQAHQPDIVLLDVQMPGMTGLELAQHLRQRALESKKSALSSQAVIASPSIIFVTAYDEYALKAFEVHAMDYLLKPVRATRLAEAIQRVSHMQNAATLSVNHAATQPALVLPTRRQAFSVLERNRVLLVPVAEVLFLKAEQKYVTVHTRARNYLLEESLTSLEEEMSDRLVRVHRNALVARNAIMGVERATSIVDADSENEKISESWQVIVRDCTERLPISRRQWPVIKALVR